ncbi:MAG TPA: efflux RND transporter periplasmic adaptor subunit [Chitinophagaceae bacterium]|nr:efflux RND transporter periplasmic adaptor subunit [Chitinophagaceae bacterium]
MLKYFTYLLFAVFLFSACNSPQPVADKTKYIIADSLLKTLQIDTVTECPEVNSLTLTGKVSFNEDKVNRIYPMLSGVITGVNVQLGDYVQKGQTLGIIKSMEMAGYGSDLVTARTNLLVAQKNMDAAADMYKSGLMSEKDYITAQQMYKQAQAQLQRSAEVLQINGGNTSGEYVIHAPISGFIVEKNINNNMSIRSDNATNLFTISDLKDVWIIANVYESNISNIKLGDSADVTTLSYPDRIFHGKVDKVLNVLDPTNKVMKVRVVLPNADYALKPEMFASVHVTTPTGNNALCVPSSALIFDQSRYFILIYNSPSDVRIERVDILGSNGNRTYIKGNVQPGSKVIASNAILIYQALND